MHTLLVTLRAFVPANIGPPSSVSLPLRTLDGPCATSTSPSSTALPSSSSPEQLSCQPLQSYPSTGLFEARSDQRLRSYETVHSTVLQVVLNPTENHMKNIMAVEELFEASVAENAARDAWDVHFHASGAR